MRQRPGTRESASRSASCAWTQPPGQQRAMRAISEARLSIRRAFCTPSIIWKYDRHWAHRQQNCLSRRSLRGSGPSTGPACMVPALVHAPPSPRAAPEIRPPLVPAVSLLSNGAPVSRPNLPPYIRFIALALAFIPHFLKPIHELKSYLTLRSSNRLTYTIINTNFANPPPTTSLPTSSIT